MALSSLVLQNRLKTAVVDAINPYLPTPIAINELTFAVTPESAINPVLSMIHQDRIDLEYNDPTKYHIRLYMHLGDTSEVLTVREDSRLDVDTDVRFFHLTVQLHECYYPDGETFGIDALMNPTTDVIQSAIPDTSDWIEASIRTINNKLVVVGITSESIDHVRVVLDDIHYPIELTERRIQGRLDVTHTMAAGGCLLNGYDSDGQLLTGITLGWHSDPVIDAYLYVDGGTHTVRGIVSPTITTVLVYQDINNYPIPVIDGVLGEVIDSTGLSVDGFTIIGMNRLGDIVYSDNLAVFEYPTINAKLYSVNDTHGTYRVSGQFIGNIDHLWLSRGAVKWPLTIQGKSISGLIATDPSATEPFNLLGYDHNGDLVSTQPIEIYIPVVLTAELSGMYGNYELTGTISGIVDRVVVHYDDIDYPVTLVGDALSATLPINSGLAKGVTVLAYPTSSNVTTDVFNLSPPPAIEGRLVIIHGMAYAEGLYCGTVDHAAIQYRGVSYAVRTTDGLIDGRIALPLTRLDDTSLMTLYGYATDHSTVAETLIDVYVKPALLGVPTSVLAPDDRVYYTVKYVGEDVSISWLDGLTESDRTLISHTLPVGIVPGILTISVPRPVDLNSDVFVVGTHPVEGEVFNRPLSLSIDPRIEVTLLKGTDGLFVAEGEFSGPVRRVTIKHGGSEWNVAISGTTLRGVVRLTGLVFDGTATVQGYDLYDNVICSNSAVVGVAGDGYGYWKHTDGSEYLYTAFYRGSGYTPSLTINGSVVAHDSITNSNLEEYGEIEYTHDGDANDVVVLTLTHATRDPVEVPLVYILRPTFDSGGLFGSIGAYYIDVYFDGEADAAELVQASTGFSIPVAITAGDRIATTVDLTTADLKEPFDIQYYRLGENALGYPVELLVPAEIRTASAQRIANNDWTVSVDAIGSVDKCLLVGHGWLTLVGDQFVSTNVDLGTITLTPTLVKLYDLDGTTSTQYLTLI